jgi:hypothetical protein
MALHKWVYEDPNDTNPTTGLYTFPHNPKSCTSPVIDRTITANGTIGGGTTTWEGATAPKQWSYTGRVESLEHYNALIAWHKRKNRFWVTDHFGRKMTVIPQTCDLVPKTNPKNYWEHDYTITVLVVEYTAGTVGNIWS